MEKNGENYGKGPNGMEGNRSHLDTVLKRNRTRIGVVAGGEGILTTLLAGSTEEGRKRREKFTK